MVGGGMGIPVKIIRVILDLLVCLSRISIPSLRLPPKVVKINL